MQNYRIIVHRMQKVMKNYRPSYINGCVGSSSFLSKTFYRPSIVTAQISLELWLFTWSATAPSGRNLVGRELMLHWRGPGCNTNNEPSWLRISCFSSVTACKWRDPTFNLGPSPLLPASFFLPYPSPNYRCLSVKKNQVQIGASRETYDTIFLISTLINLNDFYSPFIHNVNAHALPNNHGDWQFIRTKVCIVMFICKSAKPSSA